VDSDHPGYWRYYCFITRAENISISHSCHISHNINTASDTSKFPCFIDAVGINFFLAIFVNVLAIVGKRKKESMLAG
jgi:hypothetical protein